MYIPKYERFLLTGDFNSEDSESAMGDFLNLYGAKNIQKEDTCFKNVDNPSCIDLFLTNSPMSFQNTTVLANGLSDFHKMAITVFKTKFENNKPKEVTYRDYNNFSDNLFKTDLKTTLLSCCGTLRTYF